MAELVTRTGDRSIVSIFRICDCDAVRPHRNSGGRIARGTGFDGFADGATARAWLPLFTWNTGAPLGVLASLNVFKMTADYLGVDSSVPPTWLFDHQFREAPAVVKSQGTYFLGPGHPP